jgi:hypothetical protein
MKEQGNAVQQERLMPMPLPSPCSVSVTSGSVRLCTITLPHSEQSAAALADMDDGHGPVSLVLNHHLCDVHPQLPQHLHRGAELLKLVDQLLCHCE